MIRYVAAWAAIGLLVPLALLVLDRVAGAFINAFPFALLFVAWPTCFMMWMASPDWFGLGVVAFSVALNGAIYSGVGRLAWAGQNSSKALTAVSRRTSQCSGPGLALLAPAADC